MKRAAILALGTALLGTGLGLMPFAAAGADPELQANKGEALGDYEQAVGNDIEALYRVATTIDPAAREWVRNFLSANHNVRFT